MTEATRNSTTDSTRLRAKWKNTSQRWEEGTTTKPKYPQVMLQPHEKGRQVKAPNTCRRLNGLGGSVKCITNCYYKIPQSTMIEKNTTCYSYGYSTLN